jgi:ribosomal protein S18 acetylase RimI-like enzyme
MPLDDAHLAEPLLRHDFARVTTLVYLSNDRLAAAASLTASRPTRLALDTYDPSCPDEFHSILAMSYSETLDCPEVNGVRTVAEVIEGYKVQGFDPARWWLVREDNKPVGVLMTSTEAGGQTWDVGYMGVIPSARRRGHGVEMLRQVFREAHAAGANRITLCVDERNAPACRLYERMGFQVDDHRAVFLAIWQRAP